jgi:serine/threonine protein phosphatase PrpC
MRCPVCDRLYEATDASFTTDAFCEVDGERLVPERVLAATMPVAPPPASLAFLEEPTAKRVLHVASSLSPEQIEAMVESLGKLAERFDRSGLAWQPSPEDFAFGPDGKLGLLHARGVYRSQNPLDVRGPLRALGEALAGTSLAGVRTSIVELLTDPRLPVLHARDLAERLKGQSSAPQPVGRNAATFIHLGYRREKQDDAVGAVMGTRGDRSFVGMVLCDGISSSADGGFAARIATEATLDVFRRADPQRSLAEIVVHAVHRAQDEVCRRAAEVMPGAAPGSTIVVAMIEERTLAVAWAGDSRAYVLGSSPRLVTRDHSWGNEMLDTGGVAFEEAFAQPLALALTRFVGPPDPSDPPLEVDVTETTIAPGDMVLLCSDGLWSYAPSAPELAVLVRGIEADPVAAARAFVHETLVRGAHDNVSVAVCVVD